VNEVMTRESYGAVPKESSGISRREFARRAALGAAVAAGASSQLILPGAAAFSLPLALPAGPNPEEPKLSPEGRAEAEEKISVIFRKYGVRLSEEQKADVRRMILEGQEPLEQLRAFPLENSDEPATVLQPARKTAQPQPSKPARKIPASAAKPAAPKKGA
jgi:hypothetical protein